MASKRDYYEVLSVSRTASEDEIRRAFRKLARQYHPDVNRESDAETRFKEVNEAYEVLSNTEKRQSYDRFGHAGVSGQAGGFDPNAGAGFSGFGGFEDIFETFFGGATRSHGGGRRAARGSDLRFNLTLTFEEAVFGSEKTLEIPRARTCERCHGNGAEPGTEPIRCPSCNGSGEVRRVQQSIFGQFVNVTICERCHGEGQVVSTPCTECHGQGRVQRTQRLSVNIPAGVDDGQQVRLSGEGEAGPNGGPNGDLYVFLSVATHQLFKRQGQDLLYDLTVNVAQAALGDEIDVPTIDGNSVKVKVPSGTQSGKMLRLRDKGVPYLRGGNRGDQLIRIRVVVPQDLN
jgi:molecular chaperone DnaJ